MENYIKELEYKPGFTSIPAFDTERLKPGMAVRITENGITTNWIIFSVTDLDISFVGVFNCEDTTSIVNRITSRNIDYFKNENVKLIIL